MKLEKHRVYCETDTRHEHSWLEEGQTLTSCPVNPAHTITVGSDTIIETLEQNTVTLAEKKNTSGVVQFQPTKSYQDSSISVTTPDFSTRQSWWYDTTEVLGEVLTNGGLQTVYSSERTPQAGWNHEWINWKKVPNNARQNRPELKIKVYVNDVLQTSGYTVDHLIGTVTFTTPLQVTDVVKVDYHYANSSMFVLTPDAGKKLLVDYIEVQFSVNCDEIPEGCYVIFQAVYNGPAVPSMGIPADTDIPIKTYEYHSAADFLNESNKAYVCEPFMELTQKQNILPWDYLTGHLLKPVGDPTTDISKKEFNKLICYMVGDKVINNCEIATGTFYCKVEDL